MTDRRLSDLLAPHQPEWLRAGVLAWLRDGDPLAQCLGLSRAEHGRVLRDHHLVQAWLQIDPSLTPWRRSVDLAEHIRQFETAAWPRLKDRAEPDPAWSMLRTHLWHAFRVAPSMPATARMIAEIVKSGGVYISQPAAESEA